MRIQALSVEAALASLRSGPKGLTAEEARRRLREFGPNRVERLARPHLALRLLKEFTHFFALILWVAAALAFFAHYQAPGEGMGTLGWAILAVILINGTFSFWQEYRAERAISSLEQLLPHQVSVRRDGRVWSIPAAELVPGDVIFLEDGDSVPADCRLLEGFGVRVNNATLTGESVPLSREARPDDRAELTAAVNVLLAGTAVVAGQAQALVFTTGAHTELGKIAHLTQTADPGFSPLQREIRRVSRIVALLAASLGVLFYFIGQSLGLSFWQSLLFGIGIIVANVPEGLLPTVTLALAMASQRMARRGALIRHLPAVEALGAATVICTDKTGTLTQNKMTVVRLFLGERTFDVADAASWLPLARSHRRFFEAAARCHNLKELPSPERPAVGGDPMEVALVELAQRVDGTLAHGARVDEIPFDSDRRRLSTLHETEEGVLLYTKGALEPLLALATHAQLGEAVEPLSEAHRTRLLEAQDALARQGLRVLALACRQVQPGTPHEALERELTLLGLVGLEDPPRPEVPDAIARCRSAGIRIFMVTGDHPLTAQAIARQIGLATSDEAHVITGDALRRLSDSQLQLALDTPELIFARVDADQKTRVVNVLKRKGEIVAVTGDGVNDAPALKSAHIGVAMGRGGTDVAREAADMVLTDDNFATIVNAVEEGRAVYANIRRFLTYILTSNVPEIVHYLCFVLLRIPLPLTIIQILAVDLGTDMLPALALGAEKPHPTVMQVPPRRRGERLLSPGLLLRAYGFLGLLEAATAMGAYALVLWGGGWVYGQTLTAQDPLYLRATTACLAAIVLSQVVNVYLCRGDHASLFSYGLKGNRLILWGVASELALILLIVYTGPGQRVFGTAPLPLAAWLRMVPFVVAMLLLEELRKSIARAWARRRGRGAAATTVSRAPWPPASAPRPGSPRRGT
ncbi:MAG: cation-transporting P-type ATPase [Deltaproteobacteria bacterium]|nr:cation-transporting P-type ATPase [Deltaproteobacteria bacterium]